MSSSGADRDIIEGLNHSAVANSTELVYLCRLRVTNEEHLTCRYNNLDELYHSKSEEGLSRLLAFLRDEEERERLEQIERMKPIGTQVLPLPPNLPCTSGCAS